ncbi:hypothetical protein BN439_pEA290026 (plasmid) [Erwinia amylovora Ea644]|nr:hypothetical protein BN439_pEA290026 [Erwinia amylovora Ea644]CCP05052.1 hypothetical protein BN440_pEA290025 [Erwinia amylovora MR1]
MNGENSASAGSISGALFCDRGHGPGGAVAEMPASRQTSFTVLPASTDFRTAMSWCLVVGL